MLIAARRPRVVLFVPVGLTALGAAFVSLSVQSLLSEPTLAEGLGLIVALAVLLVVLGMLRIAWLSDEHVVVLGLFGRHTLDASLTVVEVRVRAGSKGPSHDVVATDRTARAVLLTAFTRSGADRAVVRLERSLGSRRRGA